MQRICCTFVVLSGSARRPPRRAVQSSNIASSTTKRSEPSGNRTRWPAAPCESVEPDRGRKPRKEESLWRQHAPHLGDHPAKMCGIIGKVEDGAADDRIECPIPQGRASALPTTRRSRTSPRPIASASRRRCSMACGSGVDGGAVVAVCQQVLEIAPRAAADIDHTATVVEPSTRKLVEEIDVNVAKQPMNGDARRNVCSGKHVLFVHVANTS